MLKLDEQQRRQLWKQLAKEIETYLTGVDNSSVTPDSTVEEIDALLGKFDFETPVEPQRVLETVADALRTHQTHVSHSRYFGLFNPAPSTMGIIADALVAAFNPQAGSWKHSPFAVQLEHSLIRMFGERFGLPSKTLGGVFCTGGSEANHTAILAALVEKFPPYLETGLSGSNFRPVLYVSSQTHHSIIKLARLCGLGSRAIRFVEVDADLKMNPSALKYRIEKDAANGFHPFMVVATAGTTNAGVIDPLRQISGIAKSYQLWFHVDAAWGGAAAFLPELKTEFLGIEQADSITFDAHKWLSVPMAAGMFLTSRKDILKKTFSVGAEYMSSETPVENIPDPYAHSLQWSRRFTGLKIFMTLAVAGWKNYEAVIRRQVQLGDFLRRELRRTNWQIVNKTPLPVICFKDELNTATDWKTEIDSTAARLEKIANKMLASGEIWISTTLLSPNQPVLRACVTNYKTNKDDVKYLAESLALTRESLASGKGLPASVVPIDQFKTL
jgi:glutamate/tyrosine decarboxylase-like PLP-dependent enzyme